jgi:hypothetical protein
MTDPEKDPSTIFYPGGLEDFFHSANRSEDGAALYEPTLVDEPATAFLPPT